MSQTPAPTSSAPLSPRGVKRAQGHKYYTAEENEYLDTLDRPKEKRKKTQKKTELQDLKEEVKFLREDLQKPWANYHGQLHTIKELQSALKAKDSGLEESRATISDLQDERDSANLELKRVMAIRNNEPARRRAICTQLQKVIYSLETVEAERDSVLDEQEQLRTQLQEKTLSLETITTERDSAHTEQKQLRTQLQKKTLSLKTCKTERDSAHDELEKARTQLQDMEKDRNTARAELKQACTQLQDLKTFHEQDLAWEGFRETTSFPETAEAVSTMDQEDMDKLFNPQDVQHQFLLPTMGWSGEAEQGYQHGWFDYSIMDVQEPINHY